MSGQGRILWALAAAALLLACGWLLASWLFAPSGPPSRPGLSPDTALEEPAQPVPPSAPVIEQPRPQPPVSPKPEKAPSPDSPALEPSADMSSPAAVMQDAAALLATRYRPGTAAGPGSVDLRLREIIERYSPPDLPPNMVYAVSPAVLKLAYVFMAKRFLELLQEQARERLPAEQRRDFLLAAADWLHGAGQCPARAGDIVQKPGPPAGGISQEDCVYAMEWLDSLLAPEDRAPVTETAANLLGSFSSSLKEKAAAEPARDPAAASN